jgi:pimeloyl-ACP methyl ester carboxylesterase
MHEKILELSGDFVIACNHRDVGGAESIAFIHGYGSAKEHFDRAFDDASLERFNLIAIDLVGFGKSRGPEDFDYGMKDQARIMLRALDRLKIGSFHLCAHSMGGLVAMEMARIEPERILSFIDMEGNLTREDCFISERIATYTADQFADHGREIFEGELEDAGEKDPALKEYVETFRRASTDALYKSAAHAFADSSAPLVDLLSRIQNTCYIYGERNRGIFPGEKLLVEKGIPIFYIEGAGHPMATENPAQLYRVIQSFIDSLQRQRHE